MTGARVAGLAAPIGTPLDEDEAGSFFEISSDAAGQHAAYNPDFEVNHGVTVLRLGDYTVDGSLSAPAPTSNLKGLPAWSCSSSNVPPVSYINYTNPGDSATDYMVKLNGAGGVFSAARIDAQLDQPSCGSLVAIDDPSFGTRRDLLLLLIGALFSFGVEVMLSASQRRAKSAVSEE
jgi:hypothetical protein